ncbi:MAG: glucan biosynthesis protein [Desulfovibrio sp.]|uniref:glucan biosynthesis protein n=1 Tax=Desulfovibrio sp. 7SRBS1 TaxID=3378064 RepID=UPI003B409512
MPPLYSNQRLARSVGLFLLLLLTVSATIGTGTPSFAKTSGLNAPGFDFARLKGYARHLASVPYQKPSTKLPASLSDLSWYKYQQITFDRSRAVWTNEQSAYRVELFHRGGYFLTPVAISLVQNGTVSDLSYDPTMFRYGDSGVDGASLPANLGYAGFRLYFKNDWTRDVVSFLGGTYFRAVGDTMQYGLSARGLAVDSGLPRPEEFPRFSHFWLEQPAPGSDSMTLYALMDSPSVAGAYKFDIFYGKTLRMKVDAAVYPRKAIERIGVAPLTSMFMVGENDRRIDYDWRPEIHDSDGLAMHAGNGEWVWRPLANPDRLAFNAYRNDNPRGFGLLQRDMHFDHYQDLNLFYEKRPGLWIEPLGDWGKGAVQLVEIPALDETFDNIVAFWHPDKPVRPGQELLYSYNLSWGTRPPLPGDLAYVVNTYTGLGGEMGKKRTHYSRRFVVDFTGGPLPDLASNTEVKAVIDASAGQVEMASVRPQPQSDGYRVQFDIVPPDNSRTPLNLRLRLEADGKPLTETWLYQWAPPAPDQRQLFNAGHLQ